MKAKYLILGIVIFFVGRYFWLKNKAKNTNQSDKKDTNKTNNRPSSAGNKVISESGYIAGNNNFGAIETNTIEKEPTAIIDEKREEVKPPITNEIPTFTATSEPAPSVFDKDPNCGVLYRCQ